MRALLRSVWVVGLRDPVREGRLRLDALGGVARQVARGGLVLLALLLVSTVAADAWRGGQLARLSGGIHELNLVPVAVIGLTLLTFAVAWVLLTWGALDGSPGVRLLVAFAFLVLMSGLDEPARDLGVDGPAMDHGPTVVRVGYLLVPAALAASAALARVARARRVVDAVLRLALMAGVVLFFGGLLWMHHAAGADGEVSTLTFALDFSVENLSQVALPLVLVSAIAVVDLAFDVSDGVRRPVSRLAARWAALLLLGLVLAKLWFLVGARLEEWSGLLAHQPLVVLRSVLSVALLVGLVAAVTRFPRSETFTDAKEKVIYLGALLLTVPQLVLTTGLGAGFAVDKLFGSTWLTRANERVPYSDIALWFLLALAVAALALGIGLMRRSEGGYGDELGAALVMVGAWNVPISILAVGRIPIGLDFPAIDLTVTLGVLAVLAGAAVRRRTVPATTSALLGAVVVFSWLVMSRADYIATLGGLIGLSAVVVVVFGVVYSIASDSTFASENSRRLPARARAQLFVGYLLLSVTIIHWLEVTHEVDAAGSILGTSGFSRIAIPLAAWLVGRRLLRS